MYLLKLHDTILVFLSIPITVNGILPQFWSQLLIIVILRLITIVTVVNGIFLQPWLDVIITIARTHLLFVICFMHQVNT